MLSTCVSSSMMRSSTSRCLMAALIRRITPRRSLSPPFMAAFMSSVSWFFRLMASYPQDSYSLTGKRKKPVSLAQHRPAFSHRARLGRTAPSIQALTLGHVARHAAQMALHRRGGLALALLRRLFVELALPGLGKDAGLFAGTLETAQRELERLVLANFDVGHDHSAVNCCPLDRASRAFYREFQ